MPAERPVELDAHFQVDLTIQINRDMAPCASDLLRSNDVPNRAAGVRHDLGEFVCSGATADDRERATAELFKPDDVFHANSLLAIVQTPTGCPGRVPCGVAGVGMCRTANPSITQDMPSKTRSIPRNMPMTQKAVSGQPCQ